jgi:hypothetical protein
MLQESGLQEAAVRQLTSCTPLLTSGRLLGIGGLANCTVGALQRLFVACCCDFAAKFKSFSSYLSMCIRASALCRSGRKCLRHLHRNWLRF